MAIDPTTNRSRDVGKSGPVGAEKPGLGSTDATAISRSADGVRDVQGAALKAAGNQLATDRVDQPKTQLAQSALPIPLPGLLPRIAPLARPGMGLDAIPSRPTLPLTTPMSKPRDKWDTKGMHGEKQDGYATPGAEDDRNPDLEGKDLEDAYKDGEWRGDKMRNQHNRRKNRKSHPRNENRTVPGFFERLKRWFSAPPPPTGPLIA